MNERLGLEHFLAANTPVLLAYPVTYFRGLPHIHSLSLLPKAADSTPSVSAPLLHPRLLTSRRGLPPLASMPLSVRETDGSSPDITSSLPASGKEFLPSPQANHASREGIFLMASAAMHVVEGRPRPPPCPDLCWESVVG